MRMKKKLKKVFTKQTILFLIMFISLFSIAFYMDKYTRTIIDINLYDFNVFRYRALWFAFSFSWIFMWLLIPLLFSKKKRVFVFNVINTIWLVAFVSQICYTQSLGKFMIVSDLFFAGEGLQYAKNLFNNLNPGMVITMFFSLACMIALIIINKKMPDKNETKKTNKYVYITFIAIFIIFRVIAFGLLGNASTTPGWEENYNVKDIYNNYSNPNNAMFVSGMYEYHLRAIYKYFYNLITFDKNIYKANVDNYNETYGVNYKSNDYTGIFKGKNVVYVMMESIDSWIIDENTMPTLYKIQNEGINFTNRYSPNFNGGQTLNSEFALNTGLYSILSNKPIYDLEDISYDYSLANILKSNGYSANSLHGNNGTFYNRTNFHQLLGYSYHYSAADLQEVGKLDEDKNYLSDSDLLSEDSLIDYLSSDQPFLAFITTYSAHLEYTNRNKVFSYVEHNLNEEDYDEEEYIYRTLAADTDRGISNLISKLEERNKLKDTVFVFVADHYVYGYSDPEYVAIKKNVNNNRNDLQKTPFIIWTPGIESKTVNTICDTADILPTMLNMLGIKYDPNNYIGTDIFADYHDNYAWFSDGTYIEGKNNNMSKEAILTKVNSSIKKNKGILLSNYYGK